MRLARVALVAGAVALGGAGCANAEARICATSGDAEFCLVESGQDFKTTGKGFRPESEVRISVDDRESNPAIRADRHGNFPPPEALTWISRGETAQNVEITGTTSVGADARFEFTVPPRRS